MIEIADIRDEDSLREWLTDWSRENGLDEDAARAVAVTIAHRAAMRILPIWWEWTLSEKARQRDFSALVALRMAMVLQIATRDAGIRSRVALMAVKIAVEKQAFAFSENPSVGLHAMCRITDSVGFWGQADQQATINKLVKSTILATAILTEKRASVRADCALIEAEGELNLAPLWVKGNPTEEIWRNIKSRATTPEWLFWIKWYDDALAGTPSNWKLLEQIALIESEIWEAGPEAVSERIALITEKYELLSEVQATRVSLAELRAEANALAQRSHNNPPELVDTDMSVIRSVEIIWTELGQAEEELKKPDPSPSRLRRISAALLEASKKVAMYCAELGDIALKNAAKEVGSSGAKWTIRVLVASYAAQDPGIQSLAARIFEFAGKLPNLP